MAGLFELARVVWHKTQPAIARRTRVCAFDRAGYGFSDPGPGGNRQDSSPTWRTTRTRRFKAGPIPGPYVLVGHSLGGIEARLYAQRWPKEVVGMVLVDTQPGRRGGSSTRISRVSMR